MRGIVLEFFYARTEPLVSIVVIVGHARAEDIQEGESRMLDPLLDQLGEMISLTTEATRHERRSRGQCQRNRIDRRLDVAKRHALGLHANAASWRSLACGQAIDLVVHDDVEQVHVAAHRMDEMVAADPKTVAVAARHHYSEFMIGKLQSGGHRQRPAVQSVHAIGIHVPGEVGGTADAADCYDVMVRYAQLDQGFLYRREHAKIAASRTPVGIDFAFQIRHGQLLTGTLYACRHLRLLLKP